MESNNPIGKNTEFKYFGIGDYTQIIELLDGHIVRAICSCKWDTIEEARYNKSESFFNKRLCKHLKQAIGELWELEK